MDELKMLSEKILLEVANTMIFISIFSDNKLSGIRLGSTAISLPSCSPAMTFSLPSSPCVRKTLGFSFFTFFVHNKYVLFYINSNAERK